MIQKLVTHVPQGPNSMHNYWLRNISAWDWSVRISLRTIYNHPPNYYNREECYHENSGICKPRLEIFDTNTTHIKTWGNFNPLVCIICCFELDPKGKRLYAIAPHEVLLLIIFIHDLHFYLHSKTLLYIPSFLLTTIVNHTLLLQCYS